MTNNGISYINNSANYTCRDRLRWDSEPEIHSTVCVPSKIKTKTSWVSSWYAWTVVEQLWTSWVQPVACETAIQFNHLPHIL